MPFVGSYRPFWLGLGALAFDLLLAVTITSMLRQRIGLRAPGGSIHWLTYASWPIALLHGLGTGSDAQSDLAAGAGARLPGGRVLAAIAFRAVERWSEYPDRGAARRSAARAPFRTVPAVWLPAGPLGSEWARRSGTPSPLLGHSAHRRARNGK